MHPIEHVIFFSGAALFYVLPSNQLHLLIYLQMKALSTATDHSFFHKILLPGKREADFDTYMHYLHHKYFEVNYASDTTFPIDAWQGTLHDGSERGQEVVKRRWRQARTTGGVG
jgi:sterol desaturase/sphingolipid hydroxylase (fatty acid hydroxylase superfamily)